MDEHLTWVLAEIRNKVVRRGTCDAALPDKAGEPQLDLDDVDAVDFGKDGSWEVVDGNTRQPASEPPPE